MQRREFIFSGLALAGASLAGCGGGSDWDELRLVRKDVARMSAGEHQTFIETLYAMKKTPSAYQPSTNAYDYFVSTHTAAFSADHINAHMSATFLPWHREFLLRFEKEMRRITGNPEMTLPYWDWQTPGSHQKIFTNEFLGGNGDVNDRNLVKTGAFREGLWSMGADFDETPNEFDDTDGDGKPDVNPTRLSRRGLTRFYSYDGNAYDSLSVIDQHMAGHPVSKLLQYANYDAAPYMDMMIGTEEWLTHREKFIAASMRKYLEIKLHNPVHAIIGGQMATGSSPNDPVFFLHHANVDRLWDVWQQRHVDAGYPSDQQSPQTGFRARLDVYAELVRAEDTFSLTQHSGVRYER